MASMLEFRTEKFNANAVKFSPYYDSRLAVSASANFGIVGNGRLYALGLTPQGVEVEKIFETNDSQYDVAWSEIHENQLAVACGDGSVKLFDTGVDTYPVMSWHEHKREALSVSWSPIAKDKFASSSWDGTIKIWSPAARTSLNTIPTKTCTYSVSWCPSDPNLVSCVSSDSSLRIFDLRLASRSAMHVDLSPNTLDRSCRAHLFAHTPSPTTPSAPTVPHEVLTHDWNKYHRELIATAGVDAAVRVWDLRFVFEGQTMIELGGTKPSPVATLLGHDYAVRKLAWSPHAANVLLTGGYDMTVRVWSEGRQLGIMNRHTEFVTGLDWCLFGAGGWVASVGWDERLLVWDANAILSR